MAETYTYDNPCANNMVGVFFSPFLEEETQAADNSG